MYADFKKKTYGRAYLAKATGLNDLDYISELLKEIEDAGMIKRTFIYGNDYMDGHINKELRVKILYEVCEDCDINWFPVNLSILKVDGLSRDKGFALKLRSVAFDDSMKIGLNRRELAEVMEVSVPTLRKKLNAVKMIGLYDDGCNLAYFPVCEKCHLNEKNVETVKAVLTSADKSSKTYKQIVWYLQNKIHYRRDANSQFDKIMGGVVGKHKTVKNYG